MSNLPRVRYAVLVAVLAQALAYVPGLGEYAGQVLQLIGLAAAGLMAVAKIIREAMASIAEEDPMIFTQGRDVDSEAGRPGFWGRVL